jgi:hypothetical protein
MKELLLWIAEKEAELPERAPSAGWRNADGSFTVTGLSLDSLAAGLVPWHPDEHIKGEATPGKRNTLSDTLKRLEERALLRRHTVTHKGGAVTRVGLSKANGGRTTHVRLTAAGVLFVRSLQGTLDLEEHATAKTRRHLEARAAGLRLARGIIAARVKERAGGAAEHEARLAFDAVHGSLLELVARLEGE